MAYDRNIDLLDLVSDPSGEDEFLMVDRQGVNGRQVRVRARDILANTPFTPSSASHPGLYNFKPSALLKWRKALANVRTGAANAKLAFVGDSTTRGIGAASDTTTFLKGYPPQVCDILNAMGVPAGKQSFFGSGNVSLDASDSRVTRSGGASYGGPNSTLGGGLLQLTAAGSFTFTPQTQVDTFDVYYLKVAGGGSSTLNVDGGATAATLTQNGTPGIYKQTVTAALGAHALNIVWVSGTCYLVGVDAYDSSKKQVSVWNMGASGAFSSDVADTTNPYSERNALAFYAPDLTVINLGINDWSNAITVGTYKANMQSIITTALASGDVILQAPVPSQDSLYALTMQKTFIDAIYEMAAASDLPVIDVWSRFGSREIMQPLGFYSDTRHPNALGYADVAQLFAKALVI